MVVLCPVGAEAPHIRQIRRGPGGWFRVGELVSRTASHLRAKGAM